MSLKIGRAAALVALTSVIAMSVTASASADAIIPFKNWAVWGSITDKKLSENILLRNEAVVLPKGSVFNGDADLTSVSGSEITGTIKGKLTVPPFKAMLALLSLVPASTGIKITQVGESTGSITTIAPSACAKSLFPGDCVKTTVISKAILGITSVGEEGIEVPVECQTSEPITLELTTIGTSGEISEEHFKGETTIPSIECGLLSGTVVSGTLLTTLMSGPENPYTLALASHEPTAPSVSIESPALPPRGITQISAEVEGLVVPEGEPLTSCEWEYGTTESYGTSIPCNIPPQSLPYTRILLTGLQENSTYHYRLTASNSEGTTHSTDRTFKTLGSAGAPEYGVCLEQRKGNYSSASCGVKASRAGKGKYEWHPGAAPSCVAHKKGEYTNSSCTAKSAKPHKGSFEKAAGPAYTSSFGTVTLEAGESKVTCSSGAGSGLITGLRTGTDRLTLSGCESGGKPCTSEGASSTPSGTAGVIESNLLNSRLLGPVAGFQVWTELASAEHQPYLAEFGCGGRLYRVAGSLSGLQRGNVGVMSSTSTTTFSSEEGEQGLTTEVSENAGSSWLGPVYSLVATVATNTSASATEIRA